MPHKFPGTSLQITEQNLSYYNSIAKQYNNMVNKNSDRTVREKVSNKFSSVVQNATVLDFGGGTGLDLEWLMKNNNKIIFCEPSGAMREVAMEAHKNLAEQNIIFLDELHADFRQWNVHPPIDEMVDAVLSNFAVLNCIPDIELLFKNLAPFIKDGGNVIALVLTKDFRKIIKTNFKSVLRSLVFKTPVSINLLFQNHQQTIYVYSIKEIMNAAKNSFTILSHETLPGSNFALIHLIKK
jgi:ubiquinone/menaquinone biosynthesis C-methylase UbiE